MMSILQPILDKASNNIKYNNILAIARDNLDKYEKIRISYDNKPSIFACECPCGSQNNKEELDEDNYIEYKEFKEQLKQEVSGGTNIEPTLRGKYLKQIQQLNKFILTTSSTEYPYHKYQEMYLSFYTIPEIAYDLGEYINKISDTYQYYIYNNKVKQITYKVKQNSHDTMVGYDIRLCIKGKLLYDYPGNYGQIYNDFIKNELVYMAIEDIIIERRTLYEIILKYFNNILVT